MNIITFDDKVALNENPNVPDINKVKDSDINQIKSALNTTIWNLIYPVGSIVIKADNEDYSNWLGFTWERTLVGRVAVGIDSTQTEFDTIGETGGEKTHTLTIQEMPSHSHTPNNNTAVMAGSGTHDMAQTSDGGRTYEFLSINNTGGGQAHNNLQPYQVVAYWKRTA